MGVRFSPRAQGTLTITEEDVIILVDLDGVLPNFEKGFLDNWRAKYPNEFFIPLEKRKTFQVPDDYPEHLKEKVWDIFLEQNFFLNLEPIPGSIEAFKTMAEKYEVFICTAPLSGSKYCVPEKYEWVEKHLGKEFVKRIILTKDKTLVYGHILIDDKPEIKGLIHPWWEHVLFDAPYNRHVDPPPAPYDTKSLPPGKARIHWSDPSRSNCDWKKFIELWY